MRRSASCRARGLREPLEAAQVAIGQAQDSLRYNIRGRALRRRLGRQRLVVAVLERTVIQVRSIIRTLVDMMDAPSRDQSNGAALLPADLGAELGRILAATAEVLPRVADTAAPSAQGRGDGPAGALRDARRLRGYASPAALANLGRLPANAWIEVGAMLAVADQMLADLTMAAELEATDERAPFDLDEMLSRARAGVRAPGQHARAWLRDVIGQ